MLATINECHWSFLTCGARISYKTNTVGRSVCLNLDLTLAEVYDVTNISP